MTSLLQSPAWQALAALDTAPAALTPRRVDAAGLSLDASRQGINDTVWNALQNLAVQEDIDGWRAKLFSGDTINNTEGRAVLHWQWRMPAPIAEIAAAKARMADVAADIHSGAWHGATGKPIRHVVNVGIGGSDLGPRLIHDALAPFGKPAITLHFVSNIDATDLARVTAICHAEETLFVIVSKSMNTLETKLNAEAARAWLQQQLGIKADLGRHMLAVTTNLESAGALGIPPENCFGFSSGVGGRYSVWSPVGLGVMIALGTETFDEFLAGAAEMDSHFQTAPLAANLPVQLALISLWQINFRHAVAEAILPYATRLALLPAYLQQLVMESNGKSVTRDGTPVDYATAPVIFGSAGTLGQHSFHQLLHQGTANITSDFILLRGNRSSEADTSLLANGLAQAAALFYGHQDSDPHRTHPGGRSSNVIVMDKLTPRTLGALLAAYEHKTFVQGTLWRINPFDQFGVELGKVMAGDVHVALNSDTLRVDAATAAFIRDYL